MEVRRHEPLCRVNAPETELLVARSGVAIRGILAHSRQHKESRTAGARRLFPVQDFQTTSIVISSSHPYDFLLIASIRLLGRMSVQLASTQSRHSFFFPLGPTADQPAGISLKVGHKE